MWSEAKAEFKDFFFFDVMGLFHITSSTLAMSLLHANEVVNSVVFFFIGWPIVTRRTGMKAPTIQKSAKSNKKNTQLNKKIPWIGNS